MESLTDPIAWSFSVVKATQSRPSERSNVTRPAHWPGKGRSCAVLPPIAGFAGDEPKAHLGLASWTCTKHFS